MAGKQNETTIKFKCDISDLKKGIQEAGRQIKLANAEFKAATAGMDNWAKSSEGVRAKIDQLQKTLTQQKSILSDYKKQLELVEQEYGKNSKEADDMRVKVLNQEAAVKKTESALKDFERQLTEVEKEEKDAAKAAEQQAGAYNKLEKEIDDQQKRLDELKNAYKQVVIEEGKDSEAAQRLAKEIDELSADLKENKDAMNAADKAADELDNSLDDVGDSADKAQGGFTVLKGVLSNLVTDILRRAVDMMREFAAATLEVGVNFDSQMSKVEAIAGATADEVERLRDKAKEMGQTTKFTATEAGEAFEYMAMAGWKTEDMLQGIEGIMNLAAASGAELGVTSDIVTDALTAFGYSAEDAGHFADILAAAATNSNTNVEMMGESFKYVAPLCGTLGYSAEDAAVALGLMANSGIKADMAGTSLRNLLQRLAKPTKESAAAMDVLGVSLYDDSGQMYSLMEVMQQLRFGMGEVQIPMDEFTKQCEELDAALESGEMKQKDYDKALEELTQRAFGAGKAEQARYVAMLAGARGLSGIMAISNATEADFNSLTDAIYNCEGAAQDMATTMLDNLGGDMTLLKSKFEGVQLALYEKLEPTLRKGVEALSKLVDVLGWVVEHADGLGAAISGVATAVGLFMIIINKAAILAAFTKGLAAIKTALLGIQAVILANPIGLLISVIAGLVVAFIYLWKHSEKFRQFWINLWEAMKLAVLTAAENISAWWNNLKENFMNGWTAIKDFFAQLWEGIKIIVSMFVQWFYGNFIVPIMDFFKPVVDFFKTAWQVIKELGQGCWEALKVIWGIVAEWFKTTIIEPVKTAFTEFWDNVKTKASEAWEFIKGVWTVVSEWFNTNIVQPVSNFFSEMWTKLKTGAKEAWEGVKSAFSPVAEWFRTTFQKAWENVKKVFSAGGAVFKGIQTGILNAFKAVVNGIIKGINRVIAVPFNAINNTLEKIRNVTIAGVRPFAGVVTRFNVPQIPLLARGGVLARGQVGLLEGSGSEAVVPLDQNKKWVSAVAQDLRRALASEGMLGGMNTQIGGATYTFIQNNTSPKALSRLDIYRQTQNQLNFAKGV